MTTLGQLGEEWSRFTENQHIKSSHHHQIIMILATTHTINEFSSTPQQELAVRFVVYLEQQLQSMTMWKHDWDHGDDCNWRPSINSFYSDYIFKAVISGVTDT